MTSVTNNEMDERAPGQPYACSFIASLSGASLAWWRSYCVAAPSWLRVILVGGPAVMDGRGRPHRVRVVVSRA